ncbi:cyclic nucleotide-binding domain-containing protein [Azospirillum sp. sgz301742]
MRSLGSLLSNVRLFATFTPKEREMLAERGHIQDAPAGTMLITEGAKADAMFALLSGSVRVLRREASGRNVVIATLNAGECFGEMALLDGGERSASIITAEPCSYFTVYRDDFWELLAPSPLLLRKLLAELSLKMRDTSRRLAHAELEARMQAAEAELRRHRAITHTVTGLAHEMNTPLGVCVTLTSLMEGWLESAPAEVAAQLQEPLAMIRDNLDSAVSLMQAFNALAADHHADPLETVDLRELIEHTSSLFALEQKEHRLSVSVDGLPSPWRGYSAPLQRVIVELLSNAAAHAYPADGGPVEIRLTADRLHDQPVYRVSVRDRGAGIAPGCHSKLIDPFFTTARGSGHKGLGLTIAYNAVTGPLGGTLTVESEPGVGTLVTLVIPALSPPAAS